MAVAAVLAGVGAPGVRADTNMTAGVVLEKMPTKELFSYVYGMVEGMAYARFRKDSLASGDKDMSGMKCIYDWYSADNMAGFERVRGAFRENADHLPAVVVAALIKKECGE